MVQGAGGFADSGYLEGVAGVAVEVLVRPRGVSAPHSPAQAIVGVGDGLAVHRGREQLTAGAVGESVGPPLGQEAIGVEGVGNAAKLGESVLGVVAGGG